MNRTEEFGHWLSMDSAPKEGACLVLLEKEDAVMGSRIGAAHFHPNISTINGRFAFDMPKPINWLPLSVLPSIPEDPQSGEK